MLQRRGGADAVVCTTGMAVVLLLLCALGACSNGDRDHALEAGTPDAASSAGRSDASTSGEACADRSCEGATPRCDALTSECVECLFDDDCGDAERCEQTRCAAVVSCRDSLDCVDAGSLVCDSVVQQCVECIAVADCPDDHDCEDARCVPFTPCETSLDCSVDQVCDSSAGRCEQCVASADCDDDEVCVDRRCRKACDSDKDCTPDGLLCDHSASHCVACVDHGRCAETLHCSRGECVRDVCRAGQLSCLGARVVRCSDVGDAYLDVDTCTVSERCVADSDGARCEPLPSEMDAAMPDAAGMDAGVDAALPDAGPCAPGCTGTDVCVAGTCVATEPLAAGLLAWWDFEPGADDTILYDRSGRGHDGTKTTDTLWVDGGLRGQALRFGGAVHIPHHADFVLDPQQDQFTILFWLNGDAIGHVDGFGIPFQKWDRLTSTPIPWSFRYDGEDFDPPLRVLVWYTDSQSYTGHYTGVMPETWHQIGFVADRGTLRLYLDGELVTETTTALPAVLSNDSELRLGGRYLGMLDEMTIHAAALTQEQIRRERTRVLQAP